jgi:hypothetical protein
MLIIAKSIQNVTLYVLVTILVKFLIFITSPEACSAERVYYFRRMYSRPLVFCGAAAAGGKKASQFGVMSSHFHWFQVSVARRPQKPAQATAAAAHRKSEVKYRCRGKTVCYV